MTCNCNSDRVEILIKQGEQRTYNFTIYNSDGTPVDLTNFYIQVEIKKYPLFKVEPLITKIINNGNTPNGWIEHPETGKFTMVITSEETSNLNPAEYYLIIYMNSYDGTSKNIISGEGEQSGILKICRQ